MLLVAFSFQVFSSLFTLSPQVVVANAVVGVLFHCCRPSCVVVGVAMTAACIGSVLVAGEYSAGNTEPAVKGDRSSAFDGTPSGCVATTAVVRRHCCVESAQGLGRSEPDCDAIGSVEEDIIGSGLSKRVVWSSQAMERRKRRKQHVLTGHFQ